MVDVFKKICLNFGSTYLKTENMKNINKILFSAFALSLVLSSCSIEKRVHNSGYHISWKNGKHADKSASEKDERIVLKKSEPVIYTETEETLTASENTVTEEKTFVNTDQATDLKSDQVAEVADRPVRNANTKTVAAKETKQVQSTETKGKHAKQLLKKSEQKKQHNQMPETAASLVLLVILAFLLPFVAVGIVTDWETGPVLISILLMLLFWIPAVIYALIIIVNRS